MKSKFLSLKKQNIIKAIVIALISGAMASLYPFLSGGEKTIFEITKHDLLLALNSGISAAVSYITATFFTNNEGKFFKKDNEK